MQSEIEQAQDHIDQIHGLNSSDDKRDAREQLAQLADVIKKQPESIRLPNRERDKWYENLLEVTRRLAFQRVVFVHETTGKQMHWLQRSVLRHLDDLHEAGIHFCLFLEDGKLLQQFPQSAHIETHQLTWKESWLREMIEWRFERYLVVSGRAGQNRRIRGKEALLARFNYDQNVYNLLLEHSKVGGEYNPRRFMKLWVESTAAKRIEDTITQTEVEEAVRRLELPGG
jgi:hypothetical protein